MNVEGITYRCVLCRTLSDNSHRKDLSSMTDRGLSGESRVQERLQQEYVGAMTVLSVILGRRKKSLYLPNTISLRCIEDSRGVPDTFGHVRCEIENSDDGFRHSAAARQSSS